MNISLVISRIVSCFRFYHHGRAFLRFAACAVLVSAFSSPVLAANTIVRMETSLGAFNIELYDMLAPLTVTNFLRYVNRGDYNNIIIHRSVPDFVIQGGGYKCCNFFGQPYHIQTDPAVQNEYDPSRSNIRGTIAMAKFGEDPNSATSEWFFNLADNSANLDYQNGGFTVFGRVLDSGMDIVDAIATLPIIAISGFPELPVISNNYVIVSRVCINADSDSACSETEDLAPGGDGNGDGIPDRDQANVTTILTSLGNPATFSADTALKFDAVGTINQNTALSWLKTFASPLNQTLHFNNGMFRFTVAGVMGTAGQVVTLHDGAATRPAYYYAYGPTPDNSTPHWYDFAFDGETGAEIKNDRIVLHFADGKRGDDDLTVNDSITHTGTQAVVTAVDDGSASGGGCSIAGTPPDATRGGDWIVVSMFLATLALVRRRIRTQAAKIQTSHPHNCRNGISAPPRGGRR